LHVGKSLIQAEPKDLALGLERWMAQPRDVVAMKLELSEEQGSSPYAAEKAMRQVRKKEGDQHVPLIENFYWWRPRHSLEIHNPVS
jgi:hypothetical protein